MPLRVAAPYCPGEELADAGAGRVADEPIINVRKQRPTAKRCVHPTRGLARLDTSRQCEESHRRR